MPLQIIRNDITKMTCDAIVNAANRSLLGGGGVDGAIHRAAGPRLLAECIRLGGCQTGQAKITKGYKLSAKYIIHTVGPVWHGGDKNEEKLLSDCYRNSLKLAKEYGCESVAFPLISAGAYGFPKDKALKIATREISDFLLENDMLVYIVVFDREAFSLSEKLLCGITEYINDNYVSEHFSSNRAFSCEMPCPAASMSMPKPKVHKEAMALNEKECCAYIEDITPDSALSLEEMLSQVDESFSQMLLRKIDEKGMTDAQCYKKANIDRKLFSKIRSNPLYKPSKSTALALAISLELSLSETKDMLMKAGFALSKSNKADIIIEYFITHGSYNIFEINEALFAFDQNLLC